MPFFSGSFASLEIELFQLFPLSFASSLRSSSFYKSEAKAGSDKFFIRGSNVNLRLSFLARGLLVKVS